MSIRVISVVLSVTCIVMSVRAQPILEWPSMAAVGFTADIVVGDPIAPTPAGQSAQVWDFSSLTGTSVGLQQILPASSSPFLPLFDGAEWITASGDQLSFWMWDEGDMVNLGSANGAVGITIPFDDPLNQWSFPMAFSDAGEDTFGTEQMLFGQPYSLQGDASYLVDAWGSITLPDGSVIDEVLRAEYTQFYMETYEGDTALWYLDQTVYLTQDSVLPVLMHENLLVTDAVGGVLLEISDVAWFENYTLSAEELSMEASKPYPNPVSRGEALNWALPAGWGWKAITLDGRVVDEGVVPATGHLRMQTGQWDAGLVLLVPEHPGLGEVGQVHRVLIH